MANDEWVGRFPIRDGFLIKGIFPAMVFAALSGCRRKRR
jgi:hypothetical protein